MKTLAETCSLTMTGPCSQRTSQYSWSSLNATSTPANKLSRNDRSSNRDDRATTSLCNLQPLIIFSQTTFSSATNRSHKVSKNPTAIYQCCGASRHCLTSRQPQGAIFTVSALKCLGLACAPFFYVFKLCFYVKHPRDLVLKRHSKIRLI